MTAAAKPARTAPTPAAGSGFTFRIARSAFLEALARAMMAAPKRTTLPILNTVLIRVSGSELTLTCSDLDQVVETKVAAVIAGTGTAALPARRLYDIVSALPSTAVLEATVSERRAKLVAGRAKFEVLGMPVEEFPKPEQDTSDASAQLDGRVLVAALKRVNAHIASSEKAGALPGLAGALLDISDAGVHLVGTDRHRLARIEIALTNGTPPLAGQFLIPKGAISAIDKLFGSAEEITIAGTRQYVEIVSPQSVLRLRLITERYPNYEHFLKLPSTAHAIIDRAAFRDAVKRVSTIAEGDYLELTFDASEVAIKANTRDAGDGEDGVACSLVSPTGRHHMALNPALLVDVLDSMEGEDVRLDFTGTNNPLYIRDAKTSESTTMGLVLGLHLRSGAV